MTELPTSTSLQRELDKTPIPSDTGITTVGIIGAGVMGRAIAACSACIGYRVRIADVDPQAAADAVHEILASSSSRTLPAPHFATCSSSPVISVASLDRGLADSDLVIEAVPENLAIKKAVLSEIEPYLSRGTVIASNTSSLPLSELAEALHAPDRFGGLHFCHPVVERMLVEVIVADTTNRETQVRALAYARALGKSPVVVRDGPGFVLNRILSPYLTEALELLLEGVDVDMLDKAARDFGMPCGPLRHLDEFGIDVSLAVGATLYRAFPDRFIPSELLIAMYKTGRRGRKSGGGFYTEDNDRISSEVIDIISQRRRNSHQVSIEELHRRLLLPMFLEATRVLEEEVVETPDIIDQIFKDGLGMTSEYRGLFGWADQYGADSLLSWLKPLQAVGRRYEATPLLLAVAEAGGGWLNR